MVAIKIKGIEIPKQCASCFARAMVDGTISTYEICALTQSVLSTEDLCNKRNHNCPLVEIEERKVGKWIKEEDTLGWDGHSYQCSICGRSIHLDIEVEDLSDYPYCHCGAKMEINEDGKWIDD